MISGPIPTRTRDGLRHVAQEHLERVERGLHIVQEELVLDGGCRVDALAKDAHGTPVLLFLAVPDEDRDLPGRVLDAQAWMAENPRLLAQALPLRGLDYERPARILVVGFELHEAQLSRLAALRSTSLEVFEVRWFSAGGELKVGMVPLAGPAARGEEDGFRVPSGLEQAQKRTLCTRLLDLLHRIDPQMEVFGDRYSRRFAVDGHTLGVLRIDGDALFLDVSEGGQAGAEATHELATWADCEAVADLVMRRYLACRGEDAAVSEPTVVRDAPSFAGVRHSLVRAQISREEYSALGGSPGDNGP